MFKNVILVVFGVMMFAGCSVADEGTVSWEFGPDRIWVGPEYWANRLQDWRVANGRLECVDHSLAGRTVHLLTKRVGSQTGDVELTVRLGAIDTNDTVGESGAGFLIGAGGAELDYRAAALVQEGPGPDGGFFAGINGNGELMIVDNSKGIIKDAVAGVVGIVPKDNWKLMYVDSAEGATKGQNVFDGDPATIWHTEWKNKKPPFPHEFQIDMGAVQSIDGFVYWPRTENTVGRVKQYEFYASTDKKNWGKAVSKGKLADGEKPEVVKFKATDVRYLKFVAVSGHQDRPAAVVAEFAVLDVRAVRHGFVPKSGKVDVKKVNAADVVLRLKAVPDGDSYKLVLSAHQPFMDGVIAVSDDDMPLNPGFKIAELSKSGIDAEALIGNIAVVSNYGSKKGTGYWFQGLSASGSKVDIFEDRNAGPILSTQYTLSEGTLKLTAQMMPVGSKDSRRVDLQVKEGKTWKNAATSTIIVPGYTATFKVKDWDDSRDIEYRVRYGLAISSNRLKIYNWGGTIRKDPVDKRQIVVAGFTGNHNNKRGFGKAGYKWNSQALWFPHNEIVKHVKAHKPDVVFFSGDQVYEGSSPTFADRKNIQLDYMYKWYLWCWAFRDITKDVQCISIPDDHDVYQGNIWGQGGRKAKRQDDGGYVHDAEFVKMVERTQTSNLPDAYDPTPIGQGIGVYYTSMNCGGVDLAILEDRKFKIGSKSAEAESGDESKHVILGDRQLAFLADWCADWSGGVKMKAALSQTVFGAMHTGWGSRGRGDPGAPSVDKDTNGWPKAGRERALRALRKGFAFMLAGDQHLAMTVHHGIDEFDDAGWSLCVPSIANFYPRQWTTSYKGKNHQAGLPGYTGQYLDGYGNKVTVWAAANPGADTGKEPDALHDKMPGYGIARFDKIDRTITMEIWPRYADPTDASTGGQYLGWPKTVTQEDNYGRKAFGYLPTIKVAGMSEPVVQVIDEDNDEIVYTLRIKGSSYQPKVFKTGTYTVKIGEPGGKMKVLSGLKPSSGQKIISVDLK